MVLSIHITILRYIFFHKILFGTIRSVTEFHLNHPVEWMLGTIRTDNAACARRCRTAAPNGGENLNSLARGDKL
jgi:hypothetical protein